MPVTPARAHPTASKSLWEAARRQLSIAGLLRTPPLWRESKWICERARLHRDPIAKGVGMPPGAGRPVFLIPGYLAGDDSLEPLASILTKAGWRPEMAGIRLNIGCASTMTQPMESRLAAHVAAHGGQRAVVIGQSRGGAFARLLAVRRPDLVAGLITLGTPLLDPLAVHILVLLNIGMVGALGTMGVPGVLKASCTRIDACCGDVRREAFAQLPDDLPFVSIYSRSDGIVDWRSCLDPAARHVEVHSSHCGMAFNGAVLRAIGDALAHGSGPAPT